MPASPPPGAQPAADTRRDEPVLPRADLWTVIAAGLLLAASIAVGIALNAAGRPVHTAAPPIYAIWQPHAGFGTPFALLIAAATVWYGPTLATVMRWRPLLVAGYLTAVAWTFALAMIDGWWLGVTNRLATGQEYLWEVPAITDTRMFVAQFTTRILDGQPDSWVTHVSGHPPGVTLVFVWLDRLGLGGGVWAATLCLLIGGLAVIAVPVTVKLLADEPRARSMLPFAVLFPGAVWVGVSADGMFMGVTSVATALLAAAATRRGPRSVTLALASGLLFGFSLFLSYGMILFGVVAFAVVLLTRRWALLGWTLAAVTAVVAAFALAGFWWLDGYHLVVQRYYQGVASERAFGYWVWANLACVTLAAGPALLVGLRRSTAELIQRRERWWRVPNNCGVTPRSPDQASPATAVGAPAVMGGPAAGTGPGVGLPAAVVVLPVAAALAMVVADLSGLSKAEIERIWLPFTIWLTAGAALLPKGGRRGWLAAQAAVALLVNHIWLTVW